MFAGLNMSINFFFSLLDADRARMHTGVSRFLEHETNADIEDRFQRCNVLYSTIP